MNSKGSRLSPWGAENDSHRMKSTTYYKEGVQTSLSGPNKKTAWHGQIVTKGGYFRGRPLDPGFIGLKRGEGGLVMMGKASGRMIPMGAKPKAIFVGNRNHMGLRGYNMPIQDRRIPGGRHS